MTNDRKKMLVIVGAGASFDNWIGVGSPNPDWNPPLTPGLFGTPPTIEHRPNMTFQRILDYYPGAKSIAADLALPHRSGPFAFEKELSAYANNPETLPDFVHVPPYIRDILGGSSVIYGANPGNYHGLIRRLISFGQYDVAVVTTNYDTILEMNLSSISGLRFQARSLHDYINSTPRVLLVKLHGSVNWYRPLVEVDNDLTRNGWFEALEKHGLRHLGSQTLVDDTNINSIGDIAGRRIATGGRSHFAYPALTAPIASKQDSVVCPASHIEALQEFVTDCHHMIVIGSSGLDEDVFNAIRPVGEITNAHFVGGTDVRDTIARFESGLHQEWNKSSISVQPNGFGTYLASTEFEDWLS